MPESSLSDDPLLKDVPEREGYKVLGGVVVYQKLGQGGMGAVYKGRHLRLNVDVAIKVMAPPPALSREQRENYVKRFLREAQTAASISHQNLVRVMDVNTEGDVYYLVMECVDGESAGERLERKSKLSEQEAVEICLGAAEGLAEAHMQAIIHRDVKPDNIMIDKRGRVKVTVLGLAKAVSGGSDSSAPSMLTETQVGMGTPYYMSPEQFTSAKTVGPQADVWSLGVTLYQLLAGELPWADSNVFSLAKKIEGEPPPDVRSLCADLSDGVCRIIDKALQKDAADRYTDCGEMAKALREHLGEIRAADESLLPDAEAGSTKLALVSLTPPATETMTLIEKSVLVRLAKESRRAAAEGAGEQEAAAAPAPATAAKLPGWVVPVVALAGVLLLVLILWALLGGKEERPTGTAPSVRATTAPRESLEKEPHRAPREVDAAEAKLATRKRREKEERPADVERRMKVEKTISEITRMVKARDWGAAWDRIDEARKAGVTDPRLDSLSRLAAAALTPPKKLTGPLGVELLLIPGGTFRMGSEKGGRHERPVHKVTLSPFYVGRYEVTKAQFEALKERKRETSARSSSGREPVVSVSWQEACDFCRYLTDIDPAPVTYRLPTEAEWEFAARGVAGRTYPWGDEAPGSKHANLAGKGDRFEWLAPVGSFPPGATPEGVMDLVGNVAEWCLDWYGRYSAAAQIDPTGPKKGKERVVRGSACGYDAKTWSMASARAVCAPGDRKDTIGFRVVRPLTGREKMFLKIAGGE